MTQFRPTEKIFNKARTIAIGPDDQSGELIAIIQEYGVHVAPGYKIHIFSEGSESNEG